MFQTSLLKDDHIEPLAEGVLSVLERVGVLCENEELCRALKEWGAEVDFAEQRVRYPRARVRDFVDALRKECAARRDAWGDVFHGPGLAGVSTQVAQLYHDYRQGETRSSDRDGFIDLTRLGAVLHPDSDVGHSLSMTDVPPLLEPLAAGLLLAEYAPIPGTPFIWHVSQAPYLQEMGEIIGRKNWFTWGAVCFAHPLRFDRDTVGKFVRRVKEGVPSGWTAMPVAGMSTPVTVEGFVVVSAAEQVATWIAARALNPTVGLTGSIWAATVDMKTGAISYSALDAMLYAFASVEFLRRWSGMRIPVGSGDYCDAKVPSLYAALEKAYKSMTVCAFTGQGAAGGGGLLDEGKIMSPVQLILDREYAAMVGELSRTCDPTPANIGLEAILEVDLGLRTNYLQTEHTLRHFRRSLWLPALIERAGYGGPDYEAKIITKIEAKLDDLLAGYRKPEGRDDQLAALRQVYDRAKRELLKTKA